MRFFVVAALLGAISASSLKTEETGCVACHAPKYIADVQ